MGAVQAAQCEHLVALDGVGLLPCPPFQRILMDAHWVEIPHLRDEDLVDCTLLRCSAAVREQHAGRLPFWQLITLCPSVGRGAAPLTLLLESHPPERLVVRGSPSMRVEFDMHHEVSLSEAFLAFLGEQIGDNTFVTKQQAEAMLRKRMTS